MPGRCSRAVPTPARPPPPWSVPDDRRRPAHRLRAHRLRASAFNPLAGGPLAEVREGLEGIRDVRLPGAPRGARPGLRRAARPGARDAPRPRDLQQPGQLRPRGRRPGRPAAGADHPERPARARRSAVAAAARFRPHGHHRRRPLGPRLRRRAHRRPARRRARRPGGRRRDAAHRQGHRAPRRGARRGCGGARAALAGHHRDPARQLRRHRRVAASRGLLRRGRAAAPGGDGPAGRPRHAPRPRPGRRARAGRAGGGLPRLAALRRRAREHGVHDRLDDVAAPRRPRALGAPRRRSLAARQRPGGGPASRVGDPLGAADRHRADRGARRGARGAGSGDHRTGVREHGRGGVRRRRGDLRDGASVGATARVVRPRHPPLPGCGALAHRDLDGAAGPRRAAAHARPWRRARSTATSRRRCSAAPSASTSSGVPPAGEHVEGLQALVLLTCRRHPTYRHRP